MKVPVQITFRYSAWPLIMLIAALTLLVAALGIVLLMMSRQRTYMVRVGQNDMRVSLKPRETQQHSQDEAARRTRTIEQLRHRDEGCSALIEYFLDEREIEQRPR